VRRLPAAVLLACLLAAGLPRETAAGAPNPPPAAPDREPEWQQVETEHFIFIFEPRDREVVNELLTFCEPMYAKICDFFRSYPKKVPCVIRGRVDEANGVTMSFPSKIELYCTAPTDHFLGARTENWLKALLAHELTHFVHQSMDTGLFHGLSFVFGADVATFGLTFLPGWMIEGPAVFDETRFTSGGRGRNPLFEMYGKAMIEKGDLFSLPRAGYLSAFPPPDRVYVAGDLLLERIYSSYGEDAFRRIVAIYLDFPFFGPWAAIEKVTGKSADAIYADMKASLEDKYRADSALPSGARVSPELIGDWTHPQPTAAGLYLYRRSPYEVSAIVRLDPVTGAQKVIATGSLTDFFSFCATSDGTTIYLSSETMDTRDATAPTLTADLWRVDARTGARHRLTRGAHLWHPAVSPDGERLIAVQGLGSYTRLVSVDAETGELRVLFSRAEGNVFTPAFSPDGSRIAFTFNLRGFQDVYTAKTTDLVAGSVALTDTRSPVVDVNESAARPVLGPDAFGEYFPAFLDSTRLLFSSDREGSLTLYSTDLGTGQTSLVQTDPVAAISAVPDGDSLLYSSYAETGWCVKKVPAAAIAPMALPKTSFEPLVYPPAFTWTGATVNARDYTDWLVPLAWTPNITLSQNGPGPLDLSIGAGALAIARSLLGRSTASVDVAWSTAASQPLAGISLSTMAGDATLSATSRIDYRYTGLYAQTLQSDIGISFPVISEGELTVSRQLSLSAGLDYLAERDEATPFSLSDALNAPASDWQKKVSVLTGVTLAWQQQGGQIDFNPPLAVEASLANGTPLLLLDAKTPESDFAMLFAVTVPSIFAHQALKLGVKATYVVGGPFFSYSDEFAVPRGFAGTYTRTAPGGALLSLDYLVPLALLDQPLPFGFALTGAALALHAEGMGQWGIVPAQASAASKLFVGGDITLQIVYGMYAFPLGIGIAARIPTGSAGSFDLGNDLRPYLFIGFDSFASLAKQGQTFRVRAGSR
jgi:hypothetical protein